MGRGGKYQSGLGSCLHRYGDYQDVFYSRYANSLISIFCSVSYTHVASERKRIDFILPIMHRVMKLDREETFLFYLQIGNEEWQLFHPTALKLRT